MLAVWTARWLAGAALLAVTTAGPRLPNAFVPSPLPLEVLPVPKELTWGQGAFVVTSTTAIVVGEHASEEDLYASRALNEEFQARFGLVLPVVRATTVPDPTGHIVIGEPATNAASQKALLAAGLTVSATSPGMEGYVLRSSPQGVLVAGSDRSGTFYGVQTLRQLLRPDGAGVSVPAVTIRDWPDHRIRAVHVLLDGASEGYLVKLISRVLAPYKFNTLIAEAEHVQWESGRPFWTPDSRGATKAQVRHLLEVAHRHHIEVIPLIATLGHSEWVFAGLHSEALCRDVAYIPRRLREQGKTEVTCNRAHGVFPTVYDPTHPITIDGRTSTLDAALIVPVLKEAIALFQPPFLHLGHDEVRGPAGVHYDLDLYFNDILALDKVLKAASVRSMLWGDVLWERRDEAQATPGYAALPRDITIVPWKYEDVQVYPEVAYFRRAGFPVIGTTWYRLDNNYYFSRAAKTAGAAGMIRATWTGQFYTAAALTRAYQQLYTYLTAGAYFWTVDRPAPAAAPSEAALAARFADAWRRPPYRQHPIPGTVINLAHALTQRHIDQDGTGWLGKGPDVDLRALRPGRHRFAGIVAEILDPRAHAGKSVVMLKGEREVAAALPGHVRIRWRGRAGCLIFVHATLDRAASFGELVGTYTMTLANGSRAVIDLRYGQNISSWLAETETGISSIEQEIAWTGKTRAGSEVAVQLLRWANPEPREPIVSIDLASAGGRASPVVFAITGLQRCP